MSAHICSDETINALAQLAPAHCGEKQAVVNLLSAENLRSYNYRYSHRRGWDDEEVEPIEYKASDALRTMTSMAIVVLCDYYDYQSCETPTYDETEAARIVAEIRRAALEQAADELLVEQDRLLALGTKTTRDEHKRLLLPGQRLDIARRDGDWQQLVLEARRDEYTAGPWGL